VRTTAALPRERRSTTPSRVAEYINASPPGVADDSAGRKKIIVGGSFFYSRSRSPTLTTSSARAKSPAAAV
jgi:hypothetical protein